MLYLSVCISRACFLQAGCILFTLFAPGFLNTLSLIDLPDM